MRFFGIETGDDLRSREVLPLFDYGRLSTLPFDILSFSQNVDFLPPPTGCSQSPFLQVLSAQRSLTTVFGMRTGDPSR